jgi:chemotaxis protein CheD
VNVTVGISDAKVSNSGEAVLATYSLGSCIGVSLYDPTHRIGGLLHYQLPTSDLDKAKAQANPMMFADTGLARLLDKLAALGADPKRLSVTLAGGAQILDDANLFNIGRRNHAAIRKLLWQRGLLIAHEEIGGDAPRNMYLRIADGAVEIKAVGHARTRAA